MSRSRFRLGRIILLTGAVCAITTSLVAVSGPVSRPAAVAQAAEVTPLLPRALGRQPLTCAYLGSNNDDMLVRPGRPGTAHEHDYAGAFGVTAATTVDTVRGKGTTCPHGDESTYWTPSLRIGGTTFRPSDMHIYFERNTTRPVTAFPPGFHMIVGDMTIKSGDTGNPHISFGCTHSDKKRSTRVTFPTCADQPKAGSEPRNTFAIWLEFPNCWDGRPARGPSMSLVYATGPDAQCPADHPTLLPTLRTVVWYDLPMTQTLHGIGLSSGRMGSAHANFVNGWSPKAMTRMVNCINTDNKECP